MKNFLKSFWGRSDVDWCSNQKSVQNARSTLVISLCFCLFIYLVWFSSKIEQPKMMVCSFYMYACTGKLLPYIVRFQRGSNF